MISLGMLVLVEMVAEILLKDLEDLTLKISTLISVGVSATSLMVFLVEDFQILVKIRPIEVEI